MILKDILALYKGSKHNGYEEELGNDTRVGIIYDCLLTKLA